MAQETTGLCRAKLGASCPHRGWAHAPSGACRTVQLSTDPGRVMEMTTHPQARLDPLPWPHGTLLRSWGGMDGSGGISLELWLISHLVTWDPLALM